MSDPQQTGFPWRARIGRVRDHIRKVAQFGVPPRMDLIDSWADELGQIIDNAAEADALPAPTCATCRFWGTGNIEGRCSQLEENDRSYKVKAWSECADSPEDHLVRVWTHASFGCLQHEARQPEEGK